MQDFKLWAINSLLNYIHEEPISNFYEESKGDRISDERDFIKSSDHNCISKRRSKNQKPTKEKIKFIRDML